MLGFFRRHPALIFIILVYPLSWYQWLLGLTHGPKDSGLNPLGPLVAGLIAALLSGGWRGLGGLMLRIVRVWASPKAWIAAVVIPIAVVALSAFIVTLRGAPAPTAAQLSDWKPLVDKLIFIFLFIGVGEESGWRGFLLDRLQSVMTPLFAAFVVGLVWAIWHAPLLRTEITPDIVGPFVASVFAGSVVLAWVYNLGGRSVPPTMLTHAVLNTIGAGFVFDFYKGAAYTELWWVNAGVWVALAALVAVVTGGRLGLKRSEGAVSQAA
jgi:membrane protease YdiL (CAAX protease family)